MSHHQLGEQGGELYQMGILGATPTAAEASKRKIYPKIDGWYEIDSAGVERKFAMAVPWVPGGRPTLATLTPVMIADVSGATTIFYTPYIHDRVPIYDGTHWTMRQFAELSNITTNSAVGKAGPAAVVADSNYDLFVWDDAGTLRLTRGPLWTSDTARGAGAGTTELVRVNGIWMNAVAITNGPAAQRGTYIGSVRSDAGATIDWELGGSAVGGDPGFLYVWSAYNRVDVEVMVTDSTAFWDYAVFAVWRSANASDSNRVSYIVGLAEDAIKASHERNAIGIAPGLGVPYIGVGFDSKVAKTGTAEFNAGVHTPLHGRTSAVVLGAHFFQALELNNGNPGVARIYGIIVAATQQGGLFVGGRF